MKTDLTVGGYLIHEDKVLLIHHRKLDLWLPVGGHIESDENPDEAMIREFQEETGIEIEILGKGDLPIEGYVKFNLATPFYVNVHSVGDHDHVGFYYVCKVLNLDNFKINKKELKNLAWFSKEDLDQNKIPRDVKSQALRAFEFYDSLEK
jgi:8-oxo-dGTP pyrophosphatase MutT (NUDIX family)